MWTRIIVLNDGETWTYLEGCRVVDVPNSVIENDEVEEYLEAEPTSGLDLKTLLKDQ